MEIKRRSEKKAALRGIVGAYRIDGQRRSGSEPAHSTPTSCKLIVALAGTMQKRAFISHISEEAAVAKRLKAALVQDFLGLLEVFVSSDTESIAAGEEWLKSIETALSECSIILILCSPESIRRPWINFEAGAAWMRKIPLVPLCHSGLLPRDLPMPLSLRQGIQLNDAEGVRRLYTRVAKVLSCQLPVRSFDALVKKVKADDSETKSESTQALVHLKDDRGLRHRFEQALRHPRFKWRSLGRVAAEAAISEERAADILRSEPEVKFSKGKTGNIIVGLRSRVG